LHDFGEMVLNGGAKSKTRVMLVSQFKCATAYSHYFCAKNKHNRYTIATSLLDATVSEYLSHCAETLTKPEPG